MEQKTKIHAEEGKQELVITRTFDLPVDLLFKAYTEPEIVEQWMGTKVLKLENKNHGSWQFETQDDKGNVVFKSNGVIHDFKMNERIIRTFEMENTPYPVQLEFLEFESISEDSSKLIMKVIFKSAEDRDNILKLPFAYGINMAHDRLESIVQKLK